MAKKILVNYNFNLNEIQNVKIHMLATDPGSPVTSQFWYNTTTNVIKYYNGTTVKTIADLSSISGLLSFQGGYNATTNSPNLTSPTAGTILKGYYYVVTTGGAFFTSTLQVGDSLFAKIDDPATLADWTIMEGNQQPSSETVAGFIEIATQAETDALTDDTRAITPLKLATNLSNLKYTKRFSQTGVSIGTTPGIQTITHNLNTRNVIVKVYDSATFESYEVDVVAATLNTVTVNANGATTTVFVVVIGN
jgi:hypothetical protein